MGVKRREASGAHRTEGEEVGAKTEGASALLSPVVGHANRLIKTDRVHCPSLSPRLLRMARDILAVGLSIAPGGSFARTHPASQGFSRVSQPQPTININVGFANAHSAAYGSIACPNLASPAGDAICQTSGGATTIPSSPRIRAWFVRAVQRGGSTGGEEDSGGKADILASAYGVHPCRYVKLAGPSERLRGQQNPTTSCRWA